MPGVIDLSAPVEMITSTKGLLAVDTPGLAKKEYVAVDNDDEHTVATEYWLHGEMVHRSVHMKLKKWPKGMEGFAAVFDAQRPAQE